MLWDSCYVLLKDMNLSVGQASSFTRFLDHTQHLKLTEIHAPGGIQTHDLSRRAAADLRLRPRGHWDRQTFIRAFAL